MSRHQKFKFKLYVAGDAQNSVQARANLSTFCRNYLPDQHEIEVVDVLREPKRALADKIFMTPTLVRFAPDPVKRLIGTLSRMDLLQTMGLEGVVT